MKVIFQPLKEDNCQPRLVYSVFHPIINQYTFFSAAHGTFSKIDHTDHILGKKAVLNKFKILTYT
jgi:hypothetical protein